MHNPLVQFGAAQAFAQSLGHVMHEIKQPLPVLSEPLVLTDGCVRLCSSPTEEDGENNGPECQGYEEKP